MSASLLTSRLKRSVLVQNWLWWRLPLPLRIYVGFMPVAALTVIGIAAAHTDWRLSDGIKFLILVTCGMISVASTPKIMYTVGGGVTRDFSSIWVLPTAILLPPVYAGLVAIPIVGALHIFVHRGVPHRMVFTAADLSLSTVAASLTFRAFPHSFAGSAVGSGFHAFTWCLAVAACEILGGRIQHFMIVGAVKLTNPKIRLFMAEFNRDNLQALFVEIDLGVLITLSVALSPALVVIALPSVLLVRRFLIFPIIQAQSRIDSKTGLLNVSTWESEAESELSRSVRTRHPLALVLIDIDHFKVVNDTYGHLAGDRVLKAIAEALTTQSRDYDRAGRFGGEEFVLLLAQTGERDACRIAERLRGYVAGLAVPADDRPDAPLLHVTISVGVTALARDESYELTDLLAAADSAMYAAKQAGRNQVACAPPLRDMGLDAAWGPAADPDAVREGAGGSGPGPASTPLSGSPLSTHRVVLVQAEQATASLCLPRSLSVPERARHEAACAAAPRF